MEEKLDGVHDSERRHAIACGSPSALERSSENRECVASDRERLSRKDWLSLVLLGLTVLGMQSDQNLLAPNLTAVSRGRTFTCWPAILFIDTCAFCLAFR